jgi:hypothetical protein
MKMTLTTSHAADLLLEDENAAWTYAGARALVEYIEEYEIDAGEEVEFDRVAIRCDWSEYASLEDWARDYFGRSDYAASEGWDEDNDNEDNIREYIEDHGQLIEFDGGIIVSSF